MLEEIGEQFAGLHGGVGKDVIAVNIDFQRVALFFQVVFHGCQDFSVGDGAGAHPDGVRIVFTGGEAEQQDGGEAQCNEFQKAFHIDFSFLFDFFLFLIRLSNALASQVPAV